MEEIAFGEGFEIVLALVRDPSKIESLQKRILKEGSGKDCFLFMLNDVNKESNLVDLTSRIMAIGALSIIAELAEYLIFDRDIDIENLKPLVERVKDKGNLLDFHKFYNKNENPKWKHYSQSLKPNGKLPEYPKALKNYLPEKEIENHKKTQDDISLYFRIEPEYRPNRIRYKYDLPEHLNSSEYLDPREIEPLDEW